MQDEGQTEQIFWDKSHNDNASRIHENARDRSRRTSSTTSAHSRRRSLSPSRSSRTPLTPEESPPFKTTGKRSACVVDSEDKALSSAATSPAHTRVSSGDSTAQVCICQPDPKIPRPRNAFILYRQHYQGHVVARHPGLANPDISKIIGEQWQNESLEQKNRWKALAEEEKLRHHQQYPDYRYQPRRTGRRGSLSEVSATGEKPKCQKCGGRTILVPSATYAVGQNSPLPPTPGSAGRTLPTLQELSLQSPATRGMDRRLPGSNMSPNHQNEDRDGIGPLDSNGKRRRTNYEQPPPPLYRAVQPRYVTIAPSGTPVTGPGTPFPFAYPMPPSPYHPPTTIIDRRGSLPTVRGPGSLNPQATMAPPPRPDPGYHQHRLSQGHIPRDRSLTLPPLQTGIAPGPSTATAGPTAGSSAGPPRTTDEQIMDIDFRYKIKILAQVAPAAPIDADAPRGPFIAVEGESVDAVRELASWLSRTLMKSDDLSIFGVDGPEVPTAGAKDEVFIAAHLLAADWIVKSKSIMDFLTGKPAPTETDINAATTSTTLSSAAAQPAGVVEETYSDDDNASHSEASQSSRQSTEEPKALTRSSAHLDSVEAQARLPGDKAAASDRAGPSVSASPPNSIIGSNSAGKRVAIISNYSLRTSNALARLIPIAPADPTDPYLPADHWQWTATQWRGIIGPDLTIYLQDAPCTPGSNVLIEAVEGRRGAGLFVVNGTAVADEPSHTGLALQESVLRRLAFEVSEWVRAFGGKK